MVTCTYSGNAAVLTLCNASKLNALTTAMLREIEEHLAEIEHNPDVRCVILTGEGPKAFCCGADIAEWGPLSPAEFARFWVRDGHRVFDRLARLSKPTIGALNGHAFGGGLELAAACDVRVITARATLALPEAKIGIVPGWSGTQRLARLLPEPVIKEMAVFGRRISAQRAFDLGFVAEVADDVLACAQEIAASLDQVSPFANEMAKAMIHGAVGEDRSAAIETLASAAAAASADRNEGVAAFLEKRPPSFTGQ
ncbi:enoyl-CoA hydratase/isomerase family protein [Pacificoceanicola onchidii]|uniref:enoyl-CoA hydratase/isomerase family protein n=1 Tax=Pacificoceanicola onchidii TaxID=2562685 RepID=UPI001F0EF8D5|nr:enoyl-CoA hydratase/isomerase family protein [Pacificoceanicola onchidii]